jgi:hypothetical protein
VDSGSYGHRSAFQQIVDQKSHKRKTTQSTYSTGLALKKKGGKAEIYAVDYYQAIPYWEKKNMQSDPSVRRRSIINNKTAECYDRSKPVSQLPNNQYTEQQFLSAVP